MNPDSKTIGDRIKQQRLKCGMTLDDVAKKVGVSRQTMSRYETGVIEHIPQQRIDEIASVLGTTGAGLLGYVDDLSTRRSSIFRKRLRRIIEQADSTDLIQKFGTTEPYGRILDGTMPITLDKSHEIADVFGVSLNYLIGTTDDPDDASLPKADLLLALEKQHEQLREEILQGKEYIEGNASTTIKAAQDALLAKVMEICKDTADLDEAQRLQELELMPSRIGQIIDFLEANKSFLHKNMPGLIPQDK